MRRLSAPLLALLLLAALPARAHDSTYSSSHIEIGTSSVEVALRLRGADLAFALDGLDADADGELSQAELDRGRRRLEAYLLAKCQVDLDGVPCPLVLGEASRTVPEEGAPHSTDLLLHLSFALAYPPGKLSFRIHPMDDNDPFHQHLATVRVLGGSPSELFLGGGDVRVVDASEHLPWHRRVSGAFQDGVFHILTGWDHLLFLLALVLAVERPWAVAGVVTGFTAGHTVTLLLAGLGILALPSRLTESAIAFSIAWVGFENTRPFPPRRRWFVATLFGLMHGFGFAATLRGKIPPDLLPLGLVLFNLGVEAGQIGVLILAWPLLRLARPWARPLSWGIACAGALLCASRLAGIRV